MKKIFTFLINCYIIGIHEQGGRVLWHYCKNGVKSHVEPFHYRFPEKSKKALNEIPTRLKQPVYMLFDYENRDPLDHQAHVTEVAAVSMAEEAKSAGKAKLC